MEKEEQKNQKKGTGFWKRRIEKDRKAKSEKKNKKERKNPKKEKRNKWKQLKSED